MGKGLVWAKDTPNFVANRIGTHAMMAGIHLMLERGLTPLGSAIVVVSSLAFVLFATGV